MINEYFFYSVIVIGIVLVINRFFNYLEYLFGLEQRKECEDDDVSET